MVDVPAVPYPLLPTATISGAVDCVCMLSTVLSVFGKNGLDSEFDADEFEFEIVEKSSLQEHA